MPSIDQAKILIISANGFEQSELMVPLEKLKQAGATVHVATRTAPVKGWKDKNWATASMPISRFLMPASTSMTRWSSRAAR